jgi:predicted phosphodiesterase
MNRRNFLKRASVGSLLAAVRPASAQAAEPGAPPAPLAFTTHPALQNPTATGVTLTIGVSGPSTAWVEYGETQQLGRLAAGSHHGLNPFAAVVHQLRLDGLRPGQECFYRVHACPIDFRNAYDIRRGPAIATEVFRFRPLDPGASTARFVVWNDTHENAATLARLMERSAPLPADFRVWNGDVTNDNYREDHMAGHYVGAGGQPLARETPLLFVRGNHDARGPLARALPRFMDPPGGRYYYSFRHGPLAGVVLDAGEDKLDTTPVYAGLGAFVAYHREQAVWLEAELKRPHLRKARFRVAFCHIPFWSQDKGFASDPGDARSAWHPLLARAKFAAVISGHTHRHGLFPPDARHPYAQLVGGGPKPEAATLIHGTATSRQLSLVMTDLDGRELARFDHGG